MRRDRGLQLIPPGTRKGNTFWLVRGTVGGRRIEVSSQTRDETAARRFADELARQVEHGGRDAAAGGTDAVAVVTWADAADRWLDAASRSRDDERYVAKLRASALGRRHLSAIVQADVDALGPRLYPRCTAETIARQVYTPAIAVLNYAAANGWCDRRTWRRPKLREPETRAAAPNAGELLLEKAEGMQRLLILWLWQHGTRITDTLRIRWDRIDLTARRYEMWINKARRWRTFPLDDVVWQELANTPEAIRAGRLFPWRDRHEVYDWLGPLTRAAGVVFTPHMARHRLGKDLDAAGAGLRTIMAALGHADAKSALRYVAEDVEIVRQAQAKRRRIAGDKAGETG